jgi:hypothetical protein
MVFHHYTDYTTRKHCLLTYQFGKMRGAAIILIAFMWLEYAHY